MFLQAYPFFLLYFLSTRFVKAHVLLDAFTFKTVDFVGTCCRSQRFGSRSLPPVELIAMGADDLDAETLKRLKREVPRTNQQATATAQTVGIHHEN